MSKKYDQLSEKQKAAFDASLKKFGLTEADVPTDINTSNYPGGLNVGVEHNSSKTITINDVDHLNSLVGFPCSKYQSGECDDSDVNYPDDFSKCSLAGKDCSDPDYRLKLSKDEHKKVQSALNAYVLGDSAKVQDYKDSINATSFQKPLALAVHGTNDLVITKDNPLIIKKETSLVYATVTIEPGGYIQAEAPFTLEAQVFTVL